ncbi:Retrovirus-related Pol polyprotein from type-1 retrotransposable element R1 3 [Eumeta japonica]|uniref:Retrovirus-related Pol polyprotein from type-1 retrotransposable element R1 3 n=1 Tax=Eumeta variegata TaxID=151549 RepID=A0A4C1WZP5_EUMVA|nr:Retrovirus-related Pol polyprotein from type-1 retrotransposable element R1 3 [Eumeta japonica]
MIDSVKKRGKKVNIANIKVMTHAKKVVTSLEEWQQRYAEGSTGEIIKCFFSRVEQAYTVLRKIEKEPQVAQTLTGHGRFAQYLYRFKLRDSPYCAFDPVKIQDLLHILEDCDMLHRERAALETVIDVRIERRNFQEILEDVTKREKFLVFCAKVVEICNRINK